MTVADEVLASRAKGEPIRNVPGEPAHLAVNCTRRFMLYRYANMLAGYYGAPVYLVGSALRDDNPEPRDWDLRIPLSRAAFERRYGDANAWEHEGVTGNWTTVRWRWAADCVKQADDGWRHTHLNLDVQTQPPGQFNRYQDEPRLRLDTMPGGEAPA